MTPAEFMSMTAPELVALVLLNFLFTWSIGMGLPALVRYAIYRRPLRRAEAWRWVIGLFLVELFFFSALGSTSRTHGALYLMGWVSFRFILTRPSSPGGAERQVARQARQI